MCVLSMLSSPNCSSPANVDAGVEWRRNRRNYAKRVGKLVQKSVSELPDGFVMPAEKKPMRMTPKPMTGFDDNEFEYELPGDEEDDFDDMEDEDTGSYDDDDGELSDITPEEMAMLDEETRRELEEDMQIDND